MPPPRASESDAPVKAWRTENSDGDRRPRAGLALLGLAVALRCIEYLHNKAIWLDEAHLALNILQRDYAGLTERLDFGQGAPLGFLWAEKFFSTVFGPGEFSLRLVPLVASLLSCVLLYTFLRRMLPGGGWWIAFSIFALAVPVIRYAAEVKAYAADLAVALALFLLLFRLERKPLTPLYGATLAIAGCASVWLAFPAVFVLGGIGTVFLVQSAQRKQWRRAAAFLLIGIAWLASIAFDYWTMLRYNTENAEVRTWWLDRFMPLPPHSLSDLNWFVRTYFEVFAEPLGLGAGGVGALLFLLGAYALWGNNRLRLALLLAPIVAALLASGLQVYPFMGRFLLFLVPVLLVGIGEGWRFLAANVRRRAVMAAAGIVLLLQPAAGAAKGILKPAAQGVRPAFQYLRDHWIDGDKLYVYHWAAPSFRYYELRTNTVFPTIEGQSLRADWAGYVAELAPLRGSERVWVFLTNTPRQLVGQEDKFILTHLDAIGERIDERTFEESSVYLYNLRASSP